MNLACRAFRTAWLSDPLQAQALMHECAECERWQRASERQQLALASMGRLTAPPELDARVAAELAGDRSRRLERVLRSLVRRASPAELDALVAQHFSVPPSAGDEERGRQKAEVLGALDVQSAPPVLERLVREELEAPDRHRIERFPGGFERLAAPAVLLQRTRARVRSRAVLRTVLGPLATLAAAALVVWFIAHQSVPERRYRFEVVQASSPGQLDPLARSLAEGLSGLAGGPGEAR